MSYRKIITLLCLSFFLSSFGIAQASSVVNVTSPSTSALSVGQSVIFSIRLNAPILCAVETSTACVVNIKLVSNEVSNLILNPSHLNWLPGNWSQTETFTASVTSHLDLQRDETATITGTITSASEYYDGETFTVSQAIKAPSRGTHCSGGGVH
jgi:hypothetical protein